MNNISQTKVFLQTNSILWKFQYFMHMLFVIKMSCIFRSYLRRTVNSTINQTVNCAKNKMNHDLCSLKSVYFISSFQSCMKTNSKDLNFRSKPLQEFFKWINFFAIFKITEENFQKCRNQARIFQKFDNHLKCKNYEGSNEPIFLQRSRFLKNTFKSVGKEHPD